MPVRDGERYLRDAIDSILAQRFTDFELLVVDDGSADESAAIVAAYRDARIRQERLARQGLAAALNRGIELARGEYLVRMDCDDVSDPDRVGAQVLFMDRHSSVGAAGTFVRARFPDGTIQQWRFPTDPEELRVALLFEPSIAHPSAILRRAWFERHGLRYDTQYVRVEDWDLWRRAARHFSMSNLPRFLLDYRVHAERMSRVHEAEQRREGLRIQGEELTALGLQDHPLRDVHARVSHGSLDCAGRDERFVGDVLAWFEALRTANARRDAFSGEAMDAILADRLLLVLHANRHLRRQVLRTLSGLGWVRRAQPLGSLALLMKTALPFSASGAAP
jgi:hypothetical protein